MKALITALLLTTATLACHARYEPSPYAVDIMSQYSGRVTVYYEVNGTQGRTMARLSANGRKRATVPHDLRDHPRISVVVCREQWSYEGPRCTHADGRFYWSPHGTFIVIGPDMTATVQG